MQRSPTGATWDWMPARATCDRSPCSDAAPGGGAGGGSLRSISVLERVAEVGGTVAILWHNDRFAGPYARGWDRCYERLLDWVGGRGGEAWACDDGLCARAK